MAQRQTTNQEALDQIKAIRLQIAMSRKTLPAQPASEEQPPVVTEPPAHMSLPQTLTDVVNMMQTLLDSMKAIPNATTAAQQQLQALQTTIDANIKPLLTTTTPPPAPSQFGPALQSKPSNAASVHPYGEADKNAKPAWGDGQGDNS